MAEVTEGIASTTVQRSDVFEFADSTEDITAPWSYVYIVGYGVFVSCFRFEGSRNNFTLVWFSDVLSSLTSWEPVMNSIDQPPRLYQIDTQYISINIKNI